MCGVPESLPATALRMAETDELVDLEKARQQHEEYLQVTITIIIFVSSDQFLVLWCSHLVLLTTIGLSL